MIRIALRKMMQKALHAQDGASGPPFTIQQVHEGTGIHRKILSRILNHPEQFTSSEHIEKLALFFFSDLRRPGMTGNDEKQLLKRVTNELVEIYPDEEAYWNGLEDLKLAADRFVVPLDILWRVSRGGEGPTVERQAYEAKKQYEKKGQQKILEELSRLPEKKSKSR